MNNEQTQLRNRLKAPKVNLKTVKFTLSGEIRDTKYADKIYNLLLQVKDYIQELGGVSGIEYEASDEETGN